MKKSKKLLVVFARNLEKGRVKKRLAQHIGEDAALELYQYLSEHTAEICSSLSVDRKIYYTDSIPTNDTWKRLNFDQNIQRGADLGERMKNAFQNGFEEGYTSIVLIGSDLWELDKEIIEKSFYELERYDHTIGPAEDGGYYLIGMTSLNDELFLNKSWGSDTVLRDTLLDLKEKSLILLDERNDIDTLEDLRAYPELQHFIKKHD